MTAFCRASLEDLGLAAGSVQGAERALPEAVSPHIRDALVFRNVLSEDECRRFIEAIERRGGWENPTRSSKVRDCERIVVESDELAQLLLDRLDISQLPSDLAQVTVTRAHTARATEELGTEGFWGVSRLNPVWRVCKYDEGGHFAPHNDGVVVLSPEERSFLTILVYLSSGFDGGATAFMRDDLTLESGHDASDQIAEVVPEPGLCLVFWQRLLHAGTPVRRPDPAMPHKYILRSDVFFRKLAEPEDPWNPDGISLLREAESLEAQGLVQESIRSYNRLRYQHPEIAEAAGVV
jgi:hypothetical protein